MDPVVCPELYNRLKRRFGNVIVANAGARMAASDFRCGTGQRKVVVEESGEYYRVNCFAPETLVATKAGDVPIRDLVGSPELLVPNAKGLGSWKRVEVCSFGRQKLLTVTLRRRGAVKVIRATPGHRWVVSGRIGLYSQKLTSDLRPGDVLASCHARSLASYADRAPAVSAVGVMRGFVFGDGSRSSSGSRPASVVIYTDGKDAALLPYFASCRKTEHTRGGRLCRRVEDLPRDWKDLPAPGESLSFLLGWFAGYFAADGTVNKNGSQATIYSARRENLNFVKGVCYQLGVRASPVRLFSKKGGGLTAYMANRTLYAVSFPVRDLPEGFWIQSHHRARVEAFSARAKAKQNVKWVVESVADYGEEDEVFCAVVPDVEKFTLSDNLLTMNCPFCHDTRKRLWVNHRFSEYPWLAHCFNETYCLSGHEGRPRRQRLFQMVFDCNRPFALPIEAGEAPENHEPGEVELPGEIIPLPRLHWTHPANQYLRDRGYDLLELDRTYGVGYCQEAEQTYWPLSGRIFIPVVMRGELVGWQGRWPQDLNWKETRIPKYYNLRGMPKRRMLYNFDNAKHYRTVVLVEGVTDVWSVGPNAVSLLGSELTSVQSALLCDVWRGGTCVVMLDGDAQENNEIMTRELSTRFQERGGHAFSIRLPPDKDPGDLSRDLLWEMIRYEARRHGAAINLDWRP